MEFMMVTKFEKISDYTLTKLISQEGLNLF